MTLNKMNRNYKIFLAKRCIDCQTSKITKSKHVRKDKQIIVESLTIVKHFNGLGIILNLDGSFPKKKKKKYNKVLPSQSRKIIRRKIMHWNRKYKMLNYWLGLKNVDYCSLGNIPINIECV